MHAWHSRTRRYVLLAAMIGLAGISLPMAAAQPATTIPAPATTSVVEHWYVVSIAGQKAGWSRETTTTTDSTITRDEEMSFTIRRESQSVTIATHTTFVESADHTPISMRSIQSIGADPTDTLYEFKPDGVRMTTVTKIGRQSTMLPPIEGEWLTPSAIDALEKQKQKVGVKSYSFRSIDASSGVTIVTQTREELSREARSIDGQDVNVVRYAVTTSAAPGLRMIETVDEKGELVVQETDTGAFTIVVTRSTKAEAGGAFQGPEIMVSTFIIPDRPIKRARSLERAEYLLSMPDGDAPQAATTGSQQSMPLPARTTRVIVHSKDFDQAQATDTQRTAALAATTLADAKDANILSLVSRATRDAAEGPFARAEAMRRFVHRFIKDKDLSVGFASASETARSAVGDCTEHGVLLAAMLRADHIPSRVASGLIYVDHLAGGKGAFGYHLWTQALLTIDGQERWVDLDATLPDRSAFDAAHIALALSDLSDTDTLSSMVSIVPLMGRLRIDVITPDGDRKDPDHAR